MAVALRTLFARSSISTLRLSPAVRLSPTVRLSPALPSPYKTHFQTSQGLPFSPSTPALEFHVARTNGLRTMCCYTYKNNNPRRSGKKKKEKGSNWQILKCWNVPWNWQTFCLSLLACGLSYVLIAELTWEVALQYSGINFKGLSLDKKAEILLAGASIPPFGPLAVLYGLTKLSSPLPGDIYRFDFRKPFNLKNGWLLWAGIGIGGALAAVAVAGAAMFYVYGKLPPRENDALVLLHPLIGSSTIRTACLFGFVGVLAPIFEETVFRGFFMASLTKWLPTPLSVLVSAAVFAAAHLTPGAFPQLFGLGTVLGFSYAQTRNLLTPITIHAFWNSGVILLLIFLKLQGYDIKRLLQGDRLSEA